MSRKVVEYENGAVSFDPQHGTMEEQWQRVFPNHSFDDISALLTRGIVSNAKPNSAYLDVEMVSDAAVVFRLEFTAERQLTEENATYLRLTYLPAQRELAIDITPAHRDDIEDYHRPITSSLALTEPYALANSIRLAKELGVETIPAGVAEEMGGVIWSKFGLKTRLYNSGTPSAEDDMTDAREEISDRWNIIKARNTLPSEIVERVDRWVAACDDHLSEIAKLRTPVTVSERDGKPLYEPLGGLLLMDIALEVEALDLRQPLPHRLQKVLDGIETHYHNQSAKRE